MAEEVKTIKIEAKGLRALQQELKATKSALLEATDPKQIEELVGRAAELKDQMADVNEQINIFATGSKYEAVSNSLGQIKDGIMSLDFDKVSERAQAFATAAGKITFKDAIGSFKSLFSTIMTMGKALLTNPIFLIGTVIALIVKAVIDLLDELGLLKKAFDILTLPLKALTEGMKKLGELMGFDMRSTEELEEIQKRQAEARVKQLSDIKTAGQKVIDNIDFEIRKAQAAGKSTVELEKQKQMAIRKTAEEQAAYIKFLMLTGRATDDQIKQFDELYTQWQKAGQELELISIKVNKTAGDNAKKRQDEIIKTEQEFNKTILGLQRQYEDEVIAGKEDGLSKDLEIINTKLKRQLEDLENTKFTEEQKLAIASEYRAIALEQEEQARKTSDEKRLEDEKSAQESLNQMLLNLNQDKFEKEQLQLDEQRETRLLKVQEDFEQGLISTEDFEKAKLAIETDYANKSKDIQITKEKELAEEKEKIRNEYLNHISNGLNSISSLMSAVNETEINLAEGNEKKQESLRKKGFEQNKKMQIAQATMAGIQGVINALTAQSVIPEPFGSILKGVNAAFVAGTTVANIAKIKSTQYGGGGGGISSPSGRGGSAATPSMPSTQERMGPSFNFQGTGGNANNVMAGGQSQSIVIQNEVMVSETEITDKQMTVANLTNSAKL
jgi:hypothetical protein